MIASRMRAFSSEHMRLRLSATRKNAIPTPTQHEPHRCCRGHPAQNRSPCGAVAAEASAVAGTVPGSSVVAAAMKDDKPLDAGSGAGRKGTEAEGIAKKLPSPIVKSPPSGGTLASSTMSFPL